MRKEIAQLEVGESIADARRLDAANGLSKVLRDMRSTVDPTVSRVRTAFPNHDIVVEQGSFITSGGAVMAVITVTRTA